MESKRWIQGAVMTLAVAAMLMTGCKHNQQTSGDYGSTTVEEPESHSTHSVNKDMNMHLQDGQKIMHAAGKSMHSMQQSVGGMNVGTLALDNAVKLEKSMPKTVSMGEQFTYDIKVMNTSGQALNDVVVTEYPASNFSFVSASPAPTGSNPMVWNIPTLGPNDSMTIKVTGTPSGEGTLKSCSTVTYVPRVCVSTEVVSPQLTLDKKYGVPEKGIAFADRITALSCDPVTVIYTVANPGTGTLNNVQVTDNLPPCMETMDGSRTVSFNVDSLGPGQERKFQTKLKALSTGDCSSIAQATSGRLKASDGAAVNVVKPALAITKSGLAEQFAGRNVRYAIAVSNTGTATATDLVVTDALDSNSTFVSATDGGTFSNGRVTWNLGSLAQGANKTVFVTVKPNSKGTISNTATANAYCAEAVSAQASTRITGIPAILLEVIDVEDPIEVGNTVTYVITATNQGSAEDTNIAITAELEQQMEYVSDGGATDGVVNGKRITFAPLPVLNVGEKATWRLTVKANAPGDVRFRVNMDTDQLTRPVMETEATNFYVTPE